jgi:uncharacterized membrane protein
MKGWVKLLFKVLLGVFFIFGGVNHFRVPDFYLKIMPDYIPAHAFVVQLSGVTEVIAGIMLLVPATSVWGAWFIVAHLVVFFTVHFWMIQHAEDRYSDVPLALLWFRIVLQVVFIVWALWFVTPDAPKPGKTAAEV